MCYNISMKKEHLIQIVKESVSIAQVLRKLKLIPAGGNYDTIKKYIKEYNLNTSHFTGQGWLKGKTHTFTQKPLSKILVDGKYYKSYRLKERLIRAGLKNRECEMCGIVKWNNKVAPLELDHISGIKTDNRIENLRILCPNCHAQTPTYRRRK